VASPGRDSEVEEQVSALAIADLEHLDQRTRDLLESAVGHLGVSPNMTKVLALSPYVLEAYVAFGRLLSAGRLDEMLRLLIPLVVAETKKNSYCLSAHMAIRQAMGLDEEDLQASRMARSKDTRIRKGLEFARAVVEHRSDGNGVGVSALRSAGYTDDEIIEIVAHVALNMFLVYLAEVANPTLGFPKVEPVASS
jgi:AhpD family alkylhydroperoxidase